ncbi:MAG: nucleotide exchange factor GrpE [Eubacteriales bacterium]
MNEDFRVENGSTGVSLENEMAAGQGTGETPEGEQASPGAELVAEKARADDYHNRLARLQADFENYKRRTRQERDDFFKYTAEQLIKALLPVLDNFERALDSCGESVDDFKYGVEMILRQFQEVLAAEGLTPIAAEGEQFDPNKHEAVLHEESESHPDNIVMEEFRRGYCLKDKVIRPAMVKIAKNDQVKSKSQEVN